MTFNQDLNRLRMAADWTTMMGRSTTVVVAGGRTRASPTATQRTGNSVKALRPQDAQVTRARPSATRRTNNTSDIYISCTKYQYRRQPKINTCRIFPLIEKDWRASFYMICYMLNAIHAI